VAVRLRQGRHPGPRDRELAMKTFLTAAVAAIVLAFAVPALADTPPTLHPGVLTVGLNMPTPGFQNGAVSGHSVVFARGFEIDLARMIAARLAIKSVSFYQEPQFLRLIAGGPKPWDIGLGEVTITPARADKVTFSVPYLDADQGVLVRRGLAVTPKSIADLAKLKLCTQSSTTAADLMTSRIQPVKPARLFGNTTLLLNALSAGTCDAVIYDAPILATLRSQVPSRYGPLIGVIPTGEQYGVLLPKGSALEAAVNDAVTALVADGRIATLAKRWLSTDLGTLPTLS
jgi:polar amino acid transport system substrate-binding protein